MTVTQIVLPILTLLVIVQSVLLLLLFRQVGSLLLATAEAAPPDGPDVGSVLTEQMTRLTGFERRRDGDDGDQTLLLLTRRGCPACETALRSLPKWLGEQGSRATLLVSGDGLRDLDPTARMRLRSSGVVEHESLEALTALGVGMTPFALLLDGEGRILAKGVLTHEEHLRRLETRAAEFDPDQG